MKRSSYYYRVKGTRKEKREEEMAAAIRESFTANQGRYGYRRITMELRQRGWQVNHKAVQRIMREQGIKSSVRMKRYRSYRGEEGQAAPNLLQRHFVATKPNEKWVTDVTEFSLCGEKLYLSPVLDLYSLDIVSYTISKRPSLELVTRMVTEAAKTLTAGETPMLHSDQGWHYRHKRYRELLERNGITQSMSRKGNCLDNAMAENFFGLLKSELFYLRTFASMSEFRKELIAYLDYYNNRRIKTRLGGLTPAAFRLRALKTS